MLQQKKIVKLFLAIITILGWFALTGQLYLILVNRTTTITATIIQYFSFFTILTNLIVAVCCTALLLKTNQYIFFSRPSTLTAITVYITIVGVVYNIMLRFLWHPQGLQRVVDELLHLVIPVLFIFFWVAFVPKSNLKWKNAITWLTYPVVYIIYIIIRGEITNQYPYPFIDVSKIGYSKAFTNTGGIFIGFWVLSLLLIAIGKISKKDNITTQQHNQ